ncbi:MAG TPA: hypothetical protein VHT75_00810 [Acidimicrobiales bacterium]|nr:hypothetical protein [Acidimicrobiales bacterium]
MTAPFPTFEAFSGCRGDTFEVAGPSGTVAMVLSTVDKWGPGEFTLHFHAPRESLLPQAIYHFQHADLGAFDIFIVPLGPDEVGMRYEAIFA